MKFIECPYCKKEAVSIWSLFFPPGFFFRACRYCNEKIKFDWFFFNFMIISFLFGAIIFNLIDKYLYDTSGFVSQVCAIFFAILPALLGIRAFKKP